MIEKSWSPLTHLLMTPYIAAVAGKKTNGANAAMINRVDTISDLSLENDIEATKKLIGKLKNIQRRFVNENRVNHSRSLNIPSKIEVVCILILSPLI